MGPITYEKSVCLRLATEEVEGGVGRSAAYLLWLTVEGRFDCSAGPGEEAIDVVKAGFCGIAYCVLVCRVKTLKKVFKKSPTYATRVILITVGTVLMTLCVPKAGESLTTAGAGITLFRSIG